MLYYILFIYLGIGIATAYIEYKLNDADKIELFDFINLIFLAAIKYNR